MTALRACLALAMAVLLGACVSPSQRPAVPVDEIAARAQDAQRSEVGAWRLTGRVAVSSGSQGGSGRIEWEQRGGHYAISLSAPVTRQGWRLVGDADGARLQGVEGGPRESADVERMLLEATGWRIPVRAMVAWVRGVAASDGVSAPARIVYGGGDVPVSLEQIGWRIDYRDWHAATTQLPALPRRIEAADAVHADARLRLIVDRWEPVTP